MPASKRTGPPSSASARRRVLAALRQDHRALEKTFRDFERLAPQADAGTMLAIVASALSLLELHAALETEVLYPALRADALQEEAIDEAQDQHAAMHELAAALRNSHPSEPRFIARFKVLGEYVRHHAREEEDELLAAPERGLVDWAGIAARLPPARERLAARLGKPPRQPGPD